MVLDEAQVGILEEEGLWEALDEALDGVLLQALDETQDGVL